MGRWLTLGVVGLIGALATGCHARAHVVYVEEDPGDTEVVYVEPAPTLVYVAPGVYVVRDSDVAVYYADGAYWYVSDGVWYQRTHYYDPWIVVHEHHHVPTYVYHCDHTTYVHYSGSGQTWSEPTHHHASPGHAGTSAHASSSPTHASSGHVSASAHGEVDARKAVRNDIQPAKVETSTPRTAVTERSEAKVSAQSSSPPPRQVSSRRSDGPTILASHSEPSAAPAARTAKPTSKSKPKASTSSRGKKKPVLGR